MAWSMAKEFVIEDASLEEEEFYIDGANKNERQIVIMRTIT